jgi:uncharacterized protein (DUF488 family)
MAISVFTIGHSNHPIEAFIGLLVEHGIEVLVDARSYPFSKFARQFDQDSLSSAVRHARMKYLFLGHELGGKPKEPHFYDEEGYVLYWKIAKSIAFQHGIERLRTGISQYRVALLCSEENPLHCHRRLLVGRVLKNCGVDVRHIRGNGYVQSEHEIEQGQEPPAQQMNLFSAGGEEPPWRSISSVSRKKELPSSSSP